jgi:esterase
MTTVKAQDKHLTVNGVRLHYLDWGTEGKTPLICLHAHTTHARIWDDFAEAMSPYYHVLAVDQRGHGESEWADTGYARDRYVEDLAAFADALELSRFVLVGCSMGGWNSMLYTVANPDRVERVVLVDIAPEPSPEHRAQAAKRPPTPMEFPSFDAVLDWIRQGNPWATEARIRKDVEAKVRQREDGRWTWKADPALFNTMLPDMTDPSMIERYWKAVEAIPCPIMEVRGAESILVSDDTLERMKQVGQQVTSVDVPGAGHVVSVDKPQEFIEATRSFLGVSG